MREVLGPNTKSYGPALCSLLGQRSPLSCHLLLLLRVYAAKLEIHAGGVCTPYHLMDGHLIPVSIRERPEWQEE